MKAMLFILSLLLMGAAHSNGNYLRDLENAPEVPREEEQEIHDIHKPGQISEPNSQEKFEEKQEDVKDFDPEYDPIDDDLEQDESVGQEL